VSFVVLRVLVTTSVFGFGRSNGLTDLPLSRGVRAAVCFPSEARGPRSLCPCAFLSTVSRRGGPPHFRWN
jgi:hypothetical protein